MIIVGNECPKFKAEALTPDGLKIVSENDLRGHYTLLFFYPLDFSDVCPTELRSLQVHIEEFSKRNIEIIAVSCDSIYIHAAFASTPHQKGGIQGVSFKMIADQSQTLSRLFGVFDEETGTALRGTFILDENLKIQYGQVNNLAFGRSIKEILRVTGAIQFAETHDSMCPINSKPGQKGVKNKFKNAL